MDANIVLVCPRCGSILHMNEHPKGKMYSCWRCPYTYFDSPGYESPVEPPRMEPL